MAAPVWQAARAGELGHNAAGPQGAEGGAARRHDPCCADVPRECRDGDASVNAGEQLDRDRAVLPWREHPGKPVNISVH
ncbi:hypothetical protein A0H81_06544 [Grifola frondosa]|uniref:Uncharacterized protein n=1 Tax=Grifola frondosa TaxID=5627 RepID=A0A1C7MA67_GRIFR|nr:hypothetical protein A0H81_06544 [Grifola frondosa]